MLAITLMIDASPTRLTVGGAVTQLIGHRVPRRSVFGSSPTTKDVCTHLRGGSVLNSQDSDFEHEIATASEPQWRSYENQVARLMASFGDAEVAHNVIVTGAVSGSSRQIDVLVKGNVAGRSISIAVECKRYKRPLGIGAIDEFVGKILDLRVDSGVLFCLNGFTEPARLRAKHALHPKIELIQLEAEEEQQEIDIDRLLFDCPADNCDYGTVGWWTWRSESGQILRAGRCDLCGSFAVECPECDSAIDFSRDQATCWCGVTVDLGYDRKGIDVCGITVRSSDSDIETEFTLDYSNS
jgi:hypothetical protein